MRPRFLKHGGLETSRFPERAEKMSQSPNNISISNQILHLVALSAIAISWPVLSFLSEHADYFFIRQLEANDVICLLVLLLAAVPLATGGLLVLVHSVSKSANRFLYGFIIFVLFTVLFVSLARQSLLVSGAGELATALVIATISVILYYRFKSARMLVGLLVISVFVVPLRFILHPNIERAVFRNDFEFVNSEARDQKLGTPDVVLVLFDELPLHTVLRDDGSIDKRRFPNFAELAEQSYFFLNASTTSSRVSTAIASLLSGLYPQEGVPKELSAASYPKSVFSSLSSTHILNAFGEGSELCPVALCATSRTRPSFRERMQWMLRDVTRIAWWVFSPSSMRSKLPDVVISWGQYLTVNLVDQNEVSKSEKSPSTMKQERRLINSFKESVKRGSYPQLYFLSLKSPSAPYRLLPDGVTYETDARDKQVADEDFRWALDDTWNVVQQYQRHLMQFGYIDTLWKELRDHLHSQARFEEALVIVTAARGMSFQAGESARRVSSKNYAEIIAVPLFIKLPYQNRQRRSARNVELVDIFPTILKVLELPDVSGINGQVIFHRDSKRKKKTFFKWDGRALEKTIYGPDVDLQELMKLKTLSISNFDSLDGHLQMGPRQDLVNMPLSEVRGELVKPITTWIVNEESFQTVDLKSNFIPVRVRGRIQAKGYSGVRIPLLIAVNNVVRTTTWSDVVYNEQAEFSGIVSRQFFIYGANKIEAFAVVLE